LGAQYGNRDGNLTTTIEQRNSGAAGVAYGQY